MSSALARTARPVVKARTPISAPGNSHRRDCRPHPAPGFTLVELLVVLVLIGIATALASVALRDPAAARLENEGARLVALLESARAEARASGLAVHFELIPTQPGQAAQAAEDFRFTGLPPRNHLPRRWLTEGVQAQIIEGNALLLGPEPLIGPQRIALQLGEQRLVLATDGLAPFAVQEAP